jgi:hypothetical protein
MMKWIPIKRGIYRSQGHRYSEIYWLRYSAVSSAAHLITQIPGNGRHAPLISPLLNPDIQIDHHNTVGKTPALYLRYIGFKSPIRKQATLGPKGLIKVEKLKLG